MSARVDEALLVDVLEETRKFALTVLGPSEHSVFLHMLAQLAQAGLVAAILPKYTADVVIIREVDDE